MISKTLSFKDYNGNRCVETFHFNISEAELIEMQVQGEDGDMASYYKRIVEAEDNMALLKAFKDIIGMAVGYKSEDGKYFRKSEQFTQDFFDSPAFSALYLEIATNPTSGSDFIEAVLPSNLSAIAEAQQQKLSVEAPTKAEDAKIAQDVFADIQNNPEKYAHIINIQK